MSASPSRLLTNAILPVGGYGWRSVGSCIDAEVLRRAAAFLDVVNLEIAIATGGEKDPAVAPGKCRSRGRGRQGSGGDNGRCGEPFEDDASLTHRTGPPR